MAYINSVTGQPISLPYTQGFIEGFIITRLASYVPKHLITCDVHIRFAPEYGRAYQVLVYSKVKTFPNPSASISKVIDADILENPIKLNEECNKISKLVVRMIGFGTLKVNKYDV